MSVNEIKSLLLSFLVLGSLVIIFMGPYICRQIKNIPIIKKQLRKYWEWKCKKYGHITHGRLTGLPQAHCRRCGEKTSNAADFCEDKVEPWGRIRMKLQSIEEIKKNLDHMGLGELISGGYFNNRIIYPTREEYEIMKVCEHCNSKYKDVDAAQKFAQAQHRYQQEEGRLYNLFKETLFYEFEVTNNNKAEKAFSIAWDRGHANGFYEVYLEFQNLVELLK